MNDGVADAVKAAGRGVPGATPPALCADGNCSCEEEEAAAEEEDGW